MPKPSQTVHIDKTLSPCLFSMLVNQTEDIGYLPNIQEGFIVDLLDALAEIVDFKYTLTLVADGR